MTNKTKLTLIIFATVFFNLSTSVVSADTSVQKVDFFIDKNYDLSQREKISATLQRISAKVYFYFDNDWWQKLDSQEKERINNVLLDLGNEFSNKIYPTLTFLFGSEPKPGIDNDERITILFHQMKEGVGGYFNNGNEYTKLENPESNEREMIYLNTDHLFSPHIKSLLAHEFIHLITFNQKENLRGIEEEVWLNELRAELAPTLLDYDTDYENSNLKERVKQFILSPSDSLINWQNQKSDYGSVNLFGQYLLDHYGKEVLIDSLRSSKAGIESINEALKKNNFEKDFSEIFTDWLITLFLNDCQISENYCYKNENLKNLKISPSLIFLPSTQMTEVSLIYNLQPFAGYWYRIIGGEGDLELKFDGKDDAKFKVPYILCQDTKICQVNFLNLDQKQDAELSFKDFAKNWKNLILIPSVHQKSPSSFSLQISLKIKSEEEKLKEELLAQIDFLKKEIARVQAEIAKILVKRVSCQRFENNLYYGMMNNPEVRCLQEFLKSQGPEIYPEGLVTGNFLSLTQQAVIRFQEKYASEILTPLGLEKGTGYLGPATRAKLNQLLK